MSERKLYLMAPTHQLDAKHVNMVFDAADIWVEEVRDHPTMIYSQFVFHHPCLGTSRHTLWTIVDLFHWQPLP